MRKVVAALALAALCCLPLAARADQDARANNVRLADENGDNGYRPVKNRAYAAIRQDMINRKVLEEYVAFMAPLRLPKTLWVYAEECDGGPGASPHYSPDQRAIVMCYQFIKLLSDVATGLVKYENKNPNALPMRMSPKGFLAGAFAGVILHESGHALFDILDVPIFGREEDAADQMAFFIATQFKPQVADLIVGALADLNGIFPDPPTDAANTNDPKYPKDADAKCQLDPFCAFSDEHGTSSQRMFNAVCVGYGSNPAHYAPWAKEGWLPKDRDCVGEYATLKHAFAVTVYPFIDPAQMKKVQAGNWFLATEMK